MVMQHDSIYKPKDFPQNMLSLAYEHKILIILSYNKTTICYTKQIKSNIKDKTAWLATEFEHFTFRVIILFAVFPDFINENNALTASLTSLFFLSVT